MIKSILLSILIMLTLATVAYIILLLVSIIRSLIFINGKPSCQVCRYYNSDMEYCVLRQICSEPDDNCNNFNRTTI